MNSMKKFVLILLFSCSLASIGKANLPESPEAYAAWEKKLLSAVETQNQAPPEVAIPKLGGWIAQVSQGMNVEKGDRPVFHAAQKALLSIPGHAKYYQKEIESMRAEVLANARLSDEELMKMQLAGNQPIHLWEYDEFRDEAFRILSRLPSSESVAVLGHFLNDPEGRDHRDLLGHYIDGSDASPTPPNADAAAMAIRNLGIEHPPFKTPEGPEQRYLREGEVDAWKDWWNEVKDGKRTYRFIGSPIEYGPDGPATPEQIQRIGRDQKREAERVSGIRRSPHSDPGATSEVSDTSKSSTIAAIVAALGAIIAALWNLLSRKSRRTG